MKLEDVPEAHPKVTVLAPTTAVIGPVRPSATTTEKKSFVTALRDTFIKPNQTTMQFIQEVRRLSDADKLYLHDLMIHSGMSVEPPTVRVPPMD